MRTLKNLSEKQVVKLAQKLAKTYKNKDVAIGLAGDLGSGKTTFTKAFASVLGVNRVKSPTFVIASEYNLKSQKLHHLDFYRLNHLDQLQAIGLNELLLNQKRIVLMEWIDKFPEVMRQCDIIIKFKIKKNNLRDVQINFL